MIATELGLSTEEVEKIRIAAQLHDVGKIGIEDRILKKPGALTPGRVRDHEDAHDQGRQHPAPRRTVA